MGTIGVILAGGLSSRMGKDKALLRLDNKHMLDKTFSVLNESNVDKVIISRNEKNGSYLPDLIPNKGPLSGIHSAAVRFPSYNLLFVPVDLPLIDSNCLNILIEHGLKFECNTRYKENPLPIFIQNTKHIKDELDNTLRSDSRYSVDGFCKKYMLEEIVLKNKMCLFNANTPEQWAFAKTMKMVNSSIENKEEFYGAPS